MLQVRLGLRDDRRNSFHAFAQIWNALLGGGEITRNQKVEAVGKALIINERVPLPFFQFFDSEYLVIDALLEQPDINMVSPGQLR